MTKHAKNVSKQLSDNLHQVFFGGNWTASNLRNQLDSTNFKTAKTKVDSCNTILALSYHIGYYVSAILGVLKGSPLESKDKFSFDHPQIDSEDEWRQLQEKMYLEVKELSSIIKNMEDAQLLEEFVDAKYGNNYRNITGLIQHTHYHLGQIVILKKLITINA